MGSTRRRSISIVIPCYNDAALLARALASLQAQTVVPDEIIVVDNNSTDDSAAVAASYPGVHVVAEPRQGITHATRCGFDAATSDILARTDADIVAPPDYVERLHRAWDAADAEHAPGARTVVAVTGSARFDIDGPVGHLASAAYLGAYRTLVGSALGHTPMFGTNYSVRRSFWQGVRDRVDFDDVAVHEDMQLSFMVAPSETVWYQEDLVVTMDPRALRGAGQLRRRFQRGWHTMMTNFRTQPPHRRLAERGLITLPGTR
ncbi:glycosyltransferase family 2 protein [Corynebacterium uterequi]|uniref:4,4'-diaponeurosporenoate glycosyltransferase n=1 Tax=Corynebacterium uterequi TaxID=1072256 RepID=A0A0G3HDK3_9CORY|nr:glycosyltransferase [Corynebacterium uterequi]AKK10048.1 Glycosyl transferase family 2 [Corynebacterium uterequi]